MDKKDKDCKDNKASKLKIFTSKNISDLKDMPILDSDGHQIYIYIMLNYPQGNIKIGKTTNIVQRLQSLSGSNGGSNKIIKLAVSEATYLKTMERTLHNHYEWYRIKGTEWFKGDELEFDKVVEYANDLFSSKEYETCNRTRKEFIEKYSND